MKSGLALALPASRNKGLGAPRDPWNPADLSGGYLFDFDFDDAGAQTLSGSNITLQANKALGGGTYTNASGIPKVANAVGAKSVATFSATGLAGDATILNLSRGVNKITAIALVKCVSGSNGGVFGWSAASPNLSRFHLNFGAASAGGVPVILQLRRLDNDSVVTITSATNVPQGSWVLLTAVYDPSTATARIRINGKDSASGSMASSGPVAYTASNESALGRQITDQNLNGQIAQILGFTLSDLDTVQRAEGYLAHRWSLQGAVLDAAHPYANTPPTSLPTTLRSLINDLGVWGASNIAGNQDGSGVTMEGVLAPLFTNPQKFLGGVPMKGVGGNTSAQVLSRIAAATALEKAADSIVQIGGSNDFKAGGIQVSDAVTTWQGIKAVFGHGRFMTWTAAFPGNAGAGTVYWCQFVDFYRRIAKLDPGRVLPMWAYAQDSALFPPITGQDAADQASSVLPATYRHDNDHFNGAGYSIQAQKMLLPAVVAFQPGAAPYFAWQEVYSTLASSQTNGGLVGTVGYYGDLTGASVAFETPDTDFAVAIVGSEIRVTRTSATVLTADYYDRRIKLTKGGKTHTDTVRMVIGTSDTAVYRVQHNGQARYAQWEGFSGVADGPKFSAVIDLELLDAAQDGVQLQLISPYTNNANLFIWRTTGNALNVILRNAAGAQAMNITASGGAGGPLNVAGGRRWLFISADVAAGLGSVYIDNIAGTTITMAPGTGANTIGLSAPHRRLSNVDAVGSTTVPKCIIGTWWEAADFIDFSQSANRDLFRHAASKMALDLGISGARVIAAGVGAGNTTTPYLFMRGNAGDRYMGLNQGNGVLGSGATRSGENFFVTSPGARLATLIEE